MTSKKATKKAAKKSTKKVAKKATKKATKKVARKAAKKATKKVARKSGETDKDSFSFRDLVFTPLKVISFIILIMAAPLLVTAIFGGVMYFFTGGDEESVETLWWLFVGGCLIFGLIEYCLSGGSSSTDYHANDNQFDGD